MANVERAKCICGCYRFYVEWKLILCARCDRPLPDKPHINTYFPSYYRELRVRGTNEKAAN